MRTKRVAWMGVSFCLLLLTRVSGFSKNRKYPMRERSRWYLMSGRLLFLVARTMTWGTNTRSS